MVKKKITYVDYNDVERTEEFCFNLTKSELTEMNLGRTGGLLALIERISAAQDMPQIIALFKEIILKSYGQKSLDGKRFIKNQELVEEFTQTEAYSILFMELATDDTAAAEFIKGIVPADLANEIAKEEAK